MPKTNKKRAKKTQSASRPTIWQALNEPVVEVSEEFAKGVFLAAAVIVMMAWVLPYWGSPSAMAAEYPYEPAVQSAFETSYYDSLVAGEQTEIAPDWYYLLQRVSQDVTFEFGSAAYDILDISDPVNSSMEFYRPGVQALWDAWLELMADPQY